jgi:CRP/FNR family cyclic AMP-dependent transcriptional regulator
VGSTREKSEILRKVSIFAGTPGETLAEVAALLEPVTIPAGMVVFHKGDPGDCLYIIVGGRVRVHDGERVFNYLGAGDVFGEMAILDAAPRSASVTALEETHLLRLGQLPFYTLMAERTEVARGVIHVLSQHLRGRLNDMAQDFVYLQQMSRLTGAAAALEAGVYDPSTLDEVAKRDDALGNLAQIFQRMANVVQAREQRLQQQVEQLRIQIDEAKTSQEVAAITETDYFQHLQSMAKKLRSRST